MKIPPAIENAKKSKSYTNRYLSSISWVPAAVTLAKHAMHELNYRLCPKKSPEGNVVPE